MGVNIESQVNDISFPFHLGTYSKKHLIYGQFFKTAAGSIAVTPLLVAWQAWIILLDHLMIFSPGRPIPRG